VKEHSKRKVSIYNVSEAAVLNQGGVCDNTLGTTKAANGILRNVDVKSLE
jgi:hypothetical protein